MRTRTPVSDEIIDRVALIWARALKRPKFDNGDDTARGALAEAMASSLAEKAIASAPDYELRVEAFRMALAAGMKHDRDHAGEPHPSPRYEGHVIDLRATTGSDYGPDATLCAAAEIANLDTSVFPWKSTVDFYSGDSISVSFGYGAEDVNHYPLSGGRWLMTTLRLTGRDKAEIIDAVENGRLDDLNVEWPGGIDRDTFATVEEWRAFQAASRADLAEEIGA